ncbi:MAG TPA: hypothetical protein VKJ65_11415, partial [Phycisphaerae bacterium]|nr:hypothetical protein [Phycisphaerae bacterium]
MSSGLKIVASKTSADFWSAEVILLFILRKLPEVFSVQITVGRFRRRKTMPVNPSIRKASGVGSG